MLSVLFRGHEKELLGSKGEPTNTQYASIQYTKNLRIHNILLYDIPAIELCTLSDIPYVYYVPSALFFHVAMHSSSGRGSYSRSRLQGTQGGGVYTTAQAWDPAGLPGAILGVQSDCVLALSEGSLSAEPEPASPMKTPKYQKKSVALPVAVPQVLSQPPKARQPRYNRRGFLFVSATNGTFACVCPWAFVHACHNRILQE